MCEDDSDCARRYPEPTGKCWASCPENQLHVGSEAREAAHHEAMQAVRETCERFESQGCTVFPPSCPPPNEGNGTPVLVCSEGTCVADG